MSNVDRDRTIENMLGDALRRQSTAAAPTAACLDAETAAAWADGALSDLDRKRAEGHVADCARCQALVAALMRTAPPVAAHSWFRFPSLAWRAPLAALTAAAAAAIVWAILPASMTKIDRATPGAERPIAEFRAPAASGGKPENAIASAAAPAAADTAPSKNAPAKTELTRDAKANGDKENAAAAKDEPNENKLKASADQNERARGREELSKQARADEAQNAKKVADAASPPAAAPAEPQAQAKRDASAGRAGGGAGAAAGATAAQRPQAIDDLLARQSVAETVTVPQQPSSRMQAAPATLAASTPVVVLSPNANNRWRIIRRPADSIVEHSTDGGSSWRLQPFAPAATVTAGASPAPTVCWLVGPRGTVIQTKDGVTWQRLTFPETIDLVAVRATDDRQATVTAVDGRTFTTADGGVTWTPPRD